MDDECCPQLFMTERTNGLDGVGNGINLVQGFGE